MKVLITSGATREYIDEVRFISNFSTGGTAKTIAEAFVARGAGVHYLYGVGAQRPACDATVEEFISFIDLNNRLQTILQQKPMDVVIHSAAVSDFSPVQVTPGKLSSESELTIQLRPNFKILARIKEYSILRKPQLVAFKLASHASPTEELALIERSQRESGSDFVVFNDLKNIKLGKEEYKLYRSSGGFILCDSRIDLARSLVDLFMGPNPQAEITL
jgi:phosphopantothenoylcysteine synthetase/decarboxylase